MSKKYRIAFIVFLALWLIAIVGVYLHGSNFEILNPKGTIAERERNLFVFASLMSVVVVIPVFVMTFYIAWKYRESNHQAQYRPDWDHSRFFESIWWGVPLLMITVLSVITWQSSQALDPFKPITSDKKPLKVQVVAMQWKWLFIYPEQNVASLNYLQIPEDTPVNFEITSDGPMNSFWIPQLGGQIYAMSGMSTQLHLMADERGSYKGSSANISGEGFSDMKFEAKASTPSDFDKWIDHAKNSGTILDVETYAKLSEPGVQLPRAYSSVARDLYDKIVMKYMAPGSQLPIIEHHLHEGHDND